MDQSQVETAQAVSTAEVARILGSKLRPSSNGSFLGSCPLPTHGEQSGRTPPLRIYADDGGWACYGGCLLPDGKQAAGRDGISLVMAARQCDFRAAVEELAPNGHGHNGNGHKPPKPRALVSPTPVVKKSHDPADWEASSDPPAELCHDVGDKLGPVLPGNRWLWRDAAERLLWVNCRFIDADGKKQYRRWRNGRWSLGGFPIEASPLYGSEHLASYDHTLPLWIVEGERCWHALLALGLQVLATAGRSCHHSRAVLSCIQEWEGVVCLWADYDLPKAPALEGVGLLHMRDIASRLPAVDSRIWCPELHKEGDAGGKGDCVQWLAQRAHLTEEELRNELISSIPARDPEPWEEPQEVPPAAIEAAGRVPPAVSISLGELCRKIIPAREDVLGGVLKKGDCSCITGMPGRGKSLIALAIAIFIAFGKAFLGLAVPKPRSVLYVDAELLEVEVKERAVKLAVGAGLSSAEIEALPLSFIIEVSQPEEPPKLRNPAGRARIEAFLDAHPEVEVLILDSIRILFGLQDENESKEWQPVTEFMLAMKRRGLTVLAVHHNSKADNFNGSLSGATPFSQIVNLTARTEGEDDLEATALDWSYGKARSLRGTEKIPFGVQLLEESGRLYWHRIEVSSAKAPKGKPGRPRQDDSEKIDQCKALRAANVPWRDIYQQLGISSGNVARWKKEGAL